MSSYCFLWTLFLLLIISNSDGLSIGQKKTSFKGVDKKGQNERSISTVNENTFKIPFGPFLVGIETFKNYYEVSLLKKEDGGRGDRKHMQFFIPAFMVASQVGWYLLAFKLVSVLAIKALLLAKVAFLAAAIVTIKRVVMDPLHNGPAITPYLDNIDPYMVPYEFPTFGHGDLHPLSLAHVGHHDGTIHQTGNLAAESSVNSVTDTVSNLNNASNNLAPSVNNAAASKSNKRSDYYVPGTNT